MGERKPLLLSCYARAARLALPFLRVYSYLRIRSGKDDRERAGERFGRTQELRPEVPLAWIHAASVGETASILPLIERLTEAGWGVLLTTVTRTSAELAAKRLPSGAVHQFGIYDSPSVISRFLDHWRPDLAMTVESEIWPATFLAVKQRGIPLVLLNGRMSDKSFGSWKKLGASAKGLFGCFDLVLAQSPGDAERFDELGCRLVETSGNLKFDARLAPPNEAELAKLEQDIGQRSVWLAALTHPGEDGYVLQAHRKLLEVYPDLLLILVPRHPERADSILSQALAQGLASTKRTEVASVERSIQAYLADTVGEMALFYAVAPFAFLGGSFTDAGGHNPLEAARAGTALITGPNLHNQRDIYWLLSNGEAVIRIEDGDQLYGRVLELLQKPELARDIAGRARKIVETGQGALERTFEALAPILDLRARSRS
ncbi:3-deoxy-D-manno-octulosonic acid transferase [Roseibium sp. RKSG952]|uniref:3-deoxy-D-manno-octulosonic acid transferase n=1 Tax=Roseibium sp. RKSG952 TaxID=2529384 RepID=UPI0012BB6433|nr:3-deoxy-D-manno-octulosonic acid transferase [Roseibium sp. RKSG952]MTI00594.1 3-deoxy-D-manno-octulosonic acid transferase [Roseibium sp. RKSG952]